MLQEISMFHIVLCLLMDLKEDGKGGFSWGLGRVLKSFTTAIVGLVQEPWEHLLARQDFLPCFSSQPIAALFHFTLLKNQKVIFPLPKGAFYLNPGMIHAMARLEISLCSSCPAALALFGVMLPLGTDQALSTIYLLPFFFYFFSITCGLYF